MSKPLLVRVLQAPFVLAGTALAIVGTTIRGLGRVLGWVAWPVVRVGLAVGAVATVVTAFGDDGEDRLERPRRRFAPRPDVGPRRARERRHDPVAEPPATSGPHVEVP